MKNKLSWLESHADAVVALGVGVALGILACMPFGLTLPGSSAELIGGLIGAVVTVGGAVLLWQAQETRQSRQLRISVAKYVLPATSAGWDLRKRMLENDRETQQERSDLAVYTERAVEYLNKAQSRFHRIEPSLQALGEHLDWFIAIEESIDPLRAVLNEIRQALRSLRPLEEVRNNHTRHLLEAVGALEAAVQILCPVPLDDVWVQTSTVVLPAREE